MPGDTLTFVVGAEKGLKELLRESDVRPLLRGLTAAGASGARLVDADGCELWRDGATREGDVETPPVPLFLEGEPVGAIQVAGDPGRGGELASLARLVAVALHTVLNASLKRTLTTEIHTTVVNSSYEELLATNVRLSESEARYRELAEHLEVRVQERTAELKKAYAHILQQEKMAAVGQLAAGVAHEINNPLGFITSNLHTLQKYVARLTTMLHFYRDELPLDPATAALAEASERKWQELKLPLVCADLGDLLSQSLSGAERVTRIVADLKGFSHVDQAGDAQIDLNEELERTLSVLSHQIRGRAEIVRELSPLPQITGEPQLAGQIFVNVIQNALATRAPDLTIVFSSAFDGERIRISIADNGLGVPKEIRGRIFEPFFTTREPGAGTGMGLAVVYEAVLKLGGTVTVADAPGGGADFIITIPIGRG